VRGADFECERLFSAVFPDQIVDALWEGAQSGTTDSSVTKSDEVLPVWLTMEPTSGGRGAWPELEKINDVASRTFRQMLNPDANSKAVLGISGFASRAGLER
jgi:hypothetical protein